MSQPFALHCLGQPRLVAPDGRPVRLKTRKHLALLVYLAVEPRVPQRRDRLATLLWEKAPPFEGRHSLATALSVLRAKLGRDCLERGRGWVRLNAPDLELDLDRLARGDVLATDLIPALDVSGFLEDFDIPDAQEFAHWCDGQRARWQPRIGDALASLMDRCRRTGDFNQIEHYADRMLQLDELNEQGIRAKMEARAFAGDRLSALKVYEAWRSQLAEELDAVPSPLLEGIAVRLRHRGLERQHTSEIAPVPTDQWKDRPFVGRAPEYRRLYEAWESSRAGQPCHYMVLGDSGVGKSTLLHRLATAAGLEGAVPARAQGHALEQKVPYAAIGTLVEDLIDRPGASCTEPAALADLAQIITRVGDRFPDLPRVPAMQGEATRIRLAESVERLLVNVAEEQPVILVVDDLHHADDASIAVLHLLMRKLTATPVMILAAARIADLAELPSGRRLMEAGDRIRLQSLELGPLSAAESESLIDTLIPPGEPHPTGTARKAVLRAGAGFPMALELLVHDWRDHGNQCLALSLDAMTEDVAVGDMPSHTYRQSFERIYRRLDPLTKNVLHLAAVLGTRLHDPRMYRLADLSLGQMMTGLIQLTSLRVLRDGGRQLEFINELIRREAYLAIPSPLRRVLHAGIADRLLGDDREGRDVPGLEIAWHLIRAGRGPEAPPYLLNGAKVAMRHGAPNEAERALSSAMEHLEEPARSEAVILLAESLQEQGKLRESLQVLEEENCECSKDLAMRRTVLRTHASTVLESIDQVTLEEQLKELLDIASSSERSVASSRALSLASTLLVASAPEETTRALSVALTSLRDRVSTPEELGNLAMVHARLLYLSRDLNEAREVISEAISSLRKHKITNSLLGTLLVGRGAVQCADGYYAEALNDFMAARANAAKLSSEWLAPSLVTNVALCLGRLGRYVEQAQWARRAITLFANGGRPDKQLKAHYYLAFSQAMLGNKQEAIQALREGTASGSQCNIDEQWWAIRSADILFLCGERAAALEYAANAVSVQFEPTSMAHAGGLARWLAHLNLTRSLSQADAETGKHILFSLGQHPAQLDKMDRIEVQAATLLVFGKDEGSVANGIGTTLEHDLRSMPPSVEDQLVRLGVV